MTTSALHRLVARAGLDEQVLSTLLFRGWSTIAGALSLVLAPLWLSPVEQGYYYTFGSVLALQIFFELGLNQIIMQLASHEAAHLELKPNGKFVGDAVNVGRLGSLARMLGHWYSFAAVLFAILGGGAGALFFSHKGSLPASSWLGAWAMLVSCTALNLWFSPKLAMLEGCGRIGEIARLRLKQSMSGYVVLWTLLACGAGLWAAISIPLAAAVCTGFWLRSNGSVLAWLHAHVSLTPDRLSWKTDVLPLQWRVALSWVSGYFIFNLFTPLVFSRYGAVEAGRLGMALTIYAAASAIGMSWVNAKAPTFTAMIARGQRAELNALFRNVALRSTVFTALICAGVVVLAWALTWAGVPLMRRIASPAVLAVLGLVTSINGIVFSMATYMRAHREEPMLMQSLGTAVLTSLVAWGGSRLGVLPMMTLYSCVVFFVSFPWATAIFLRYYRRT